MHVKFKESNSLVKNVVEIDFLREHPEKISLKNSPAQDDEDKLKDNTNGEVQDVEVEPTQPLSKDWRYTTNHLKDFFIGDVSKGITTRFKLHDLCGHLHSSLILSPMTFSKLRATHIGYLTCKKSLINLNATKFGILFLGPMIDQLLVLNRFLRISWMSQKILLGIKLG